MERINLKHAVKVVCLEGTASQLVTGNTYWVVAIDTNRFVYLRGLPAHEGWGMWRFEQV